MSLFTRDDSELSFQKRQKELKEVCHNFKQVLSDIKSISQQSEILSNNAEIDEEYAADVSTDKKNSTLNSNLSNKSKKHKITTTNNNDNHIDFIVNNDEFDDYEFPNSKKTEMITELCQLRAIIRELYSIKYEILNLSLKLKHINGIQANIAKKLNNKISEITQVVSQNISRAELLLTEIY